MSSSVLHQRVTAASLIHLRVEMAPLISTLSRLPEDPALVTLLQGESDFIDKRNQLLEKLEMLRSIIGEYDTSNAMDVLSIESNRASYSHNARIQRVLSDEERMVGRLQANRSNITPIGHGVQVHSSFSLTTDSSLVTTDNEKSAPRQILFDDSDFVHELDKEDEEMIIEHAVIERLLRSTDSESDFSSYLVKQIEKQKQKRAEQIKERMKQNHKREHHRDSKHRKITEDIHNEIVSFMAPVSYPQSDNPVTDALYTVLFKK